MTIEHWFRPCNQGGDILTGKSASLNEEELFAGMGLSLFLASLSMVLVQFLVGPKPLDQGA